jgi:hypothetical protein
MATISYIQEHNQSAAAMKAVIDYCCQDKKVYDVNTNRRLVSGINCDGENAYKEFMATKKTYHKTDGMFFYQYTQSFSPRENITPEQAHEIALEFAEKAWQGYEVMVATHSDREHIHSHFVINSVGFEDGLKLRQSPNTLKALRRLSDEICGEHGLSVLKPYDKSGMKMSTKEYRVAVRGQSWKFKLMADIETAMEYSGSRRDFVDNMSSLGYSMTWTPQRKYITFLCPNGMKCRDIKLHEGKFLKENIENELRIRESKYDGDAKTDEQKIAQRHRDVAGRDEDNLYTYSGQGGRDGTIENSGEFSTRAVQENRRDTDSNRNGQVYGSSGEHRHGVLHEAGEYLSGGISAGKNRDNLEYGTDGEEYSGDTRQNASEYRTGWEESRELFEQHIAERERAGADFSSSSEEGRYTVRSEVDSNFDSVLGGIDSLASSVSKIIDDGSEDEEERRKRIQAEENANNLGAILGTAIGLMSEAFSSNEYDKNYDEDYDEDKEENIDFGMSM